MNEQRSRFLQRSLIAGCASVALIVFLSFCSVVHGAVDRAAQHRLAAAETLGRNAAHALQRTIPASQRAAAQGALLARAGS